MIQPRRIAQVALIAAIALLTSAAAQQTVLVEHAQGTTEVTLRPAKVFSFDYATIDTLTALGIAIDGAPPLAGVGADRYDLSNAVVLAADFRGARLFGANVHGHDLAEARTEKAVLTRLRTTDKQLQQAETFKPRAL